MSVIYGLDPGTTQSAIVVLGDGCPIRGAIWENAALILQLRANTAWRDGTLVIEQIESMGMAVGKETFETVFWSGRFAEAWEQRGRTWSRVPRRAVKLHLCGSMRAKDPNIRQALLDRYGGVAAGKKGGALAGIKSHLWAALAVAITYADSVGATRRQETA